MRAFKRDSNNDFTLSNKDIAMTDDLQAVMTNCESAAQTLLFEQLYNYENGLPNFELIWNGNPNLRQYEVALRSALLKVDGVLKIISLNAKMENNILSYKAVIETQFGLGKIEK